MSSGDPIPVQRERIGVGHFLLWIAGTSVALATLNFAFPMDDLPSEFFASEGIRRFFASTAYGAALAGWLWILFRRWTRRAFELRQPGHYLLVMAGAVAIVDLGCAVLAAEAVGLELSSDSALDHYEAHDVRLFVSYLIGCLLCLVIYRDRVLKGIWKFALMLMFARCIAFLILYFFECHYDFTRIPQSYFMRYVYGGLIIIGEVALVGVSVLFTLGLISDLALRRTTRDWVHFVGVIASIAICASVSAGELIHGQSMRLLAFLVSAIQQALGG